ncbi:hypothetical protein [Mesorhizobium sp. M0041]|uniref:hypothetical protein n=1 Tax=Mesorhizobium sp. M0041 TaxID=2956856 RepID=UPI00333DA7E2
MARIGEDVSERLDVIRRSCASDGRKDRGCSSITGFICADALSSWRQTKSPIAEAAYAIHAQRPRGDGARRIVSGSACRPTGFRADHRRSETMVRKVANDDLLGLGLAEDTDCPASSTMAGLNSTPTQPKTPCVQYASPEKMLS